METNLGFLGGRPVITVLEGQVGKYELTALPKKRGKCSGAVAFVAGKNPIKYVSRRAVLSSLLDHMMVM